MDKRLDVALIVRLALVAVAAALFIDTFGFRQFGEGPFGPKTWPRAILLLLTASVAADIYFSRRRGQEEGGSFMPAVDLRRVALFTSCLALYVAGMTVVGFPLATFLFCVAWQVLHRVYEPVRVSVISLAVTISVVLIFLKLLYLALPRGVGVFYDFTNLILAFIGR